MESVVFIAPAGDAVHDFRARLPARWLAEREGWPAEAATWEELPRRLQSALPPQLWLLSPPALGLPGALVTALAQLPIRVCVNLSPPPWCLPPWHPVWARVPRDYAFPVHRRLLRMAERAIVHDAAVLPALEGRPAVVIPDALAELPPEPARPGDRPLTLAWLGSGSHGGDLALVLEPLRALLARGAARVVFLGAPVPRALAEFGAEAEPGWTALAGCLERLAALAPDALLLPLADEPANEYRGGSALLLAGAVGAAVIASARGPYARLLRPGAEALLVADAPAAWAGALAELAVPGRRAALAAALRAWVARGRLLAHTGPAWARALAP
jgi:hypothetical protein